MFFVSAVDFEALSARLFILMRCETVEWEDTNRRRDWSRQMAAGPVLDFCILGVDCWAQQRGWCVINSKPLTASLVRWEPTNALRDLLPDRSEA